MFLILRKNSIIKTKKNREGKMEKHNEPNANQPLLLKLRNLRQARGLSIGSLAEKMGADYQQISRLERGKTQLTVEMLEKISKVLETPIAEIIKEQDENEDQLLSSLSNNPKRINNKIFLEIHDKLEEIFKENQINFSVSDKMILTTDIYNHIIELKIISHKNIEPMLDLIFNFLEFILKKVSISHVSSSENS